MIASLKSFFVPSYFTVFYAFLFGTAYGVTGQKYGFAKVTAACLICSVAYVAYMLGAFK